MQTIVNTLSEISTLATLDLKGPTPAGVCVLEMENLWRDDAGYLCSLESQIQFTPQLPHYWLSTEFALTREIIDVLDEGREATNASEFFCASSRKRLVIIMRFVRANISWDYRMAEKPPREFDTIIRTGLGCCQHFAMLFAAVACEAGLPVKLVRGNGYPESLAGHVWLEVEKYIVDPTANYVATFGEALAIAKRDLTSWQAEFYTNSNRIYDDVF